MVSSFSTSDDLKFNLPEIVLELIPIPKVVAVSYHILFAVRTPFVTLFLWHFKGRCITDVMSVVMIVSCRLSAPQAIFLVSYHRKHDFVKENDTGKLLRMIYSIAKMNIEHVQIWKISRLRRRCAKGGTLCLISWSKITTPPLLQIRG